MSTIDVACLISGGKDSIYACYIAKQYGWNIKNLISVIPEKLSWMYHFDNIWVVNLIAEAMDVPILTARSKAIKEKELEDLKSLIEKADVDAVIAGAISSEYQRTRLERICHEIDVKSFMPLWHKNQKMLLEEMLNAGFKIMIDAVAAAGLDEEFLGKIIDEDIVNKLDRIYEKYKINFAGEGGEYETLVVDCPLYRKKIVVEDGEIIWNGSRGSFLIKKAKLAEK
ncbi:MAG: diphthine--ammonia ligase [Thermoplasmata archaeon]|nr:diphthine--ammonia ligase [Thermoplasmata archaeon]